MPVSVQQPMARHSARVQQKRERRRRQILHAALEAFRERGYHGATLDDIGVRLGVRKTALYHYFPDKEAILYACHREALDELERILADAPAHGRSSSEQIRFVIREHVRVMAETLQGSSLAFETTSLSPVHATEVITRRDAYERAVRLLIEAAVREGSFSPVDSKVAAFVIFGAVNWVARWYRPDGSLRPAELGSQFADYLTGGLLCR